MNVEPTKLIFITPPRYVLLPAAHAMIRRKIQRGDWQEGKLWRRAPDGRIVIDLDGFEKWVESGERPTRR